MSGEKIKRPIYEFTSQRSNKRNELIFKCHHKNSF